MCTIPLSCFTFFWWWNRFNSYYLFSALTLSCVIPIVYFELLVSYLAEPSVKNLKTNITAWTSSMWPVYPCFGSFYPKIDQNYNFITFRLVVWTCVIPIIYFQLILSYLSRIVSCESQNKMSLNNVAMIMAPNLFSGRAISRKKSPDYSELHIAAGTSNIMRMLVKYHNILWVVCSHSLYFFLFTYLCETNMLHRVCILCYGVNCDHAQVSNNPCLAEI